MKSGASLTSLSGGNALWYPSLARPVSGEDCPARNPRRYLPGQLPDLDRRNAPERLSRHQTGWKVRTGPPGLLRNHDRENPAAVLRDSDSPRTKGVNSDHRQAILPGHIVLAPQPRKRRKQPAPPVADLPLVCLGFRREKAESAVAPEKEPLSRHDPAMVPAIRQSKSAARSWLASCMGHAKYGGVALRRPGGNATSGVTARGPDSSPDPANRIRYSQIRRHWRSSIVSWITLRDRRNA